MNEYFRKYYIHITKLELQLELENIFSDMILCIIIMVQREYNKLHGITYNNSIYIREKQVKVYPNKIVTIGEMESLLNSFIQNEMKTNLQVFNFSFSDGK